MAIVFQTFNRADSTRLIHVTKSANLADLWVYPVNYLGGHRGDWIWYFTDNRAEATIRVYLCSQAEAQTKVYFVDKYADAGWQMNQKLATVSRFSDFPAQLSGAKKTLEEEQSFADIADEILGVGDFKADKSPNSLLQSITNFTDNQQHLTQNQLGSTPGQAVLPMPIGKDRHIGKTRDALTGFSGQYRGVRQTTEKTSGYRNIDMAGLKANTSESKLQQSTTNVTDENHKIMQGQQGPPASKNRGKIEGAVKEASNKGDS